MKNEIIIDLIMDDASSIVEKHKQKDESINDALKLFINSWLESQEQTLDFFIVSGKFSKNILDAMIYVLFKKEDSAYHVIALTKKDAAQLAEVGDDMLFKMIENITNFN